MNELALNTITNLQRALESVPAVTTDMREFTNHFFAPGIYLRTIFIPKGFVLVGEYHKYEAINILLKGKLSIVTMNNERVVAEAPFIFRAAPGQKAGYAIEDSWYASIHPNEDDTTDIEKLEDRYVIKTSKPLEALQ